MDNAGWVDLGRTMPKVVGARTDLGRTKPAGLKWLRDAGLATEKV